jgi:hypothetical protein
MPFTLIWTRPAHDGVVRDEWNLAQEAVRPEDGDTVRRWAQSTYDVANQVEHTQDRYELIRAGEVVDSELQARSAATCWYTLQQAADLYSAAGFVDVRLVSGFTDEAAAAAADTIFSVFGTRPVATAPRAR